MVHLVRCYQNLVTFALYGLNDRDDSTVIRHNRVDYIHAMFYRHINYTLDVLIGGSTQLTYSKSYCTYAVA